MKFIYVIWFHGNFSGFSNVNSTESPVEIAFLSTWSRAPKFFPFPVILVRMFAGAVIRLKGEVDDDLLVLSPY